MHPTLRHYLNSHPFTAVGLQFFSTDNLSCVLSTYPVLGPYLECCDFETLKTIVDEYEKFLQVPGRGALKIECEELLRDLLQQLNNNLVTKLLERYRADICRRKTYFERKLYRIQPTIVNYGATTRNETNRGILTTASGAGVAGAAFDRSIHGTPTIPNIQTDINYALTNPHAKMSSDYFSKIAGCI